ncbi:hypothetical protein L9F63_023139, partial [Diploptera punctata]
IIFFLNRNKASESVAPALWLDHSLLFSLICPICSRFFSNSIICFCRDFLCWNQTLYKPIQAAPFFFAKKHLMRCNKESSSVFFVNLIGFMDKLTGTDFYPKASCCWAVTAMAYSVSLPFQYCAGRKNVKIRNSILVPSVFHTIFIRGTTW